MTPGPTPSATDEEIISAISGATEPFTTAGDVAEAVGLSRQRAHDRLQRLYESGRIEKTKVGGSAVVWWISED